MDSAKEGITALAGALPAELAGIRGLGAFKKEMSGGLRYLRGGIHGVEVALFVSGIGEERAYETAKAACAGLPVKAYISVGFSAALRPGLKTGDTIIGEKIKLLASKEGEIYSSDPGLLRIAGGSLQTRLSGTGELLCSRRVVVSAVEKKALSLAHPAALALDMETAGAARAAREAGVPFLALRAVSDTLDEDLPVDFNRFMKAGCLDWPSFIGHVVTHPGVIPGLIRLGRNSRHAAKMLAVAVVRVLVNIYQ